jgi:hypothetical protein
MAKKDIVAELKAQLEDHDDLTVLMIDSGDPPQELELIDVSWDGELGTIVMEVSV